VIGHVGGALHQVHLGVERVGAGPELEEIDASDLTEHSARFEALYQKLQESLKSIDNL
jgi:hypothetical protein